MYKFCKSELQCILPVRKLLFMVRDFVKYGCIDDNEKADNLYKSLGFKTMQVIHIYRKFL